MAKTEVSEAFTLQLGAELRGISSLIWRRRSVRWRSEGLSIAPAEEAGRVAGGEQLHVQTLTVKWWISLREWLRFGSAAYLLRVLSSCMDNLFLLLAMPDRAHEAVRILFLRSAPGVH